MNRAWRIAACAALLAVAAPGEGQTPVPAPVSDEQSYKDAMECKVRVEALEAVTRDKGARKRLGSALAYWVEKERAAGTRLGKNSGDMLADEMMFGFAEASNPEGLRRAELCVRGASTGSTES